MTSYRPEIDGLRAVSILAVVGYHAGVPWLPGGYIGVDVFFVISGYLITGLLRAELERKGRIDFAAFYVRRIRRLLPAAALVVLATVTAGALLLSPALGEVQSVAKSALATLLICANLYYLRHSLDYFATADDRHPLLHTWSLSVEEQFYLVWPVLMFLGWKLGAVLGRPLLVLRVTLLIVILVSALFAAFYSAGYNVYAFYLMPARAWELGAGAILAALSAYVVRIPPRIAAQLSVAGMSLIVGACVWMEPSGEFPFPLAVIPVLGTILVIVGSQAAPGSVVAKLLATRVMVMVGLASYAWYLWHWPILTIARVRDLGEADLGRDLLLACVSLVLAFLTLHYVERPLRFSVGKSASVRRVMQTGAIVTGVLLLLSGSVGWLAKTLPLAEDEMAVKSALSDHPPLTDQCHASFWAEDHGDAPCLAGAGQRRIVIWGDSHANHWTPALHAWAANVENGPVIEQWTLDACPPIFEATPTAVLTRHRIGFEACRAFNERVRRRLTTVAAGDRLGVIVASNWWYRTGDVRWKSTEPAHSFELTAVGERASLGALENYLNRSLQEITSAGYPVLVMLQSPVFEYAAPECVLRRGPAACGTTRTAHAARADKVNSTIRRIVDTFPTARVLDPAALLCDDEVCPPVIGGVVAYTDRDHLAAAVAHALAPRIAAEFERLTD